MAKLGIKEIHSLARKIIAAHPGGIRYQELVKKIFADHPESKINTIYGAVWNLHALFPKEISKPSYGLYVPLESSTTNTVPEPKQGGEVKANGKKLKEADFYRWVAAELQGEWEDGLVHVEPLGGSSMRDKWGTPDVLGVYRHLRTDPIEFPIEIVSCEVKIDTSKQALVEAFGQVIAYRLFSHKTYIVVPVELPKQEKARLLALCIMFGVGLVFFHRKDRDRPDFEIIVRAQHFSPDRFYVNEFVRRLREFDAEKCKQLFG